MSAYFGAGCSELPPTSHGDEDEEEDNTEVVEDEEEEEDEEDNNSSSEVSRWDWIGCYLVVCVLNIDMMRTK